MTPGLAAEIRQTIGYVPPGSRCVDCEHREYILVSPLNLMLDLHCIVDPRGAIRVDEDGCCPRFHPRENRCGSLS